MRRLLTFPYGLVVVAGAVLLTTISPAQAQVVRGPHPDTVLSRDGALIWYTGLLDVQGRKWREMDEICRTVPVSEISGWRAPTMAELRTLMFELPRVNAVTRWTELHFADPALLTPAIPPFAYGARLHPQIYLMSRDLFTYEGQPTTLDRVIRGRMYVVHWFDRWTHPFLSRDRSIRHNPGDFTLGSQARLLCVAQR